MRNLFFALVLLTSAFTGAQCGNTATSDATDKNIVEVAASNEAFTTLVSAVKAAGLAETLSGEGPFTVFAPTNAAFEKLPEGTVAELLKPENSEMLTSILTYHVVAGKFDAEAVVGAINDGGGMAELETVEGGTLTAKLEGDAVVLTDEQGNTSTVTTTDVMASNGLIHIIDAVVMPAMEKATPNIVEVASGNENFSTLVAAVKAADLAGTLSGAGPFTVFAPTNAAFEKLPEGTVATLLEPENKGTLAGILTYHVVPGKLDAAAVTAAIEAGNGTAEVETVAGGTLMVMVQDGNVVLKDEQGNISTVTATDVEASNGVIHIIDTVVMPE